MRCVWFWGGGGGDREERKHISWPTLYKGAVKRQSLGWLGDKRAEVPAGGKLWLTQQQSHHCTEQALLIGGGAPLPSGPVQSGRIQSWKRASLLTSLPPLLWQCRHKGMLPWRWGWGEMCILPYSSSTELIQNMFRKLCEHEMPTAIRRGLGQILWKYTLPFPPASPAPATCSQLPPPEGEILLYFFHPPLLHHHHYLFRLSLLQLVLQHQQNPPPSSQVGVQKESKDGLFNLLISLP